jgi:hypothetical protein
MHLVDMIDFILEHHGDVQIALQIVGDSTIPKESAQVHL